MVPWTFGQELSSSFQNARESALSRKHDADKQQALFNFQAAATKYDWGNRFKYQGQEHINRLDAMSMANLYDIGRSYREHELGKEMYSYQLGENLEYYPSLEERLSPIRIREHEARTIIDTDQSLRRTAGEQEIYEPYAKRAEARQAKYGRMRYVVDILTGQGKWLDPAEGIPPGYVDPRNYKAEAEIFSQSAAGRKPLGEAPRPPEISPLQMAYMAGTGPNVPALGRLGTEALFAIPRLLGFEPYESEYDRFNRKGLLWSREQQRSPLDRARSYYSPDDDTEFYRNFWNLGGD